MSVQLIETTTPDFRVMKDLMFLNDYYPGFNDWYRNKFIQSLKSDEGKIILALEDDKLVGLSLLKKSTTENKIRCLRVNKSHQDTGLGIKLMDKSIELLEDVSPVVTVAEEMINLYSRIFVNRYGFQLDDVAKGLYRKGKLEYCFNSK